MFILGLAIGLAAGFLWGAVWWNIHILRQQGKILDDMEARIDKT